MAPIRFLAELSLEDERERITAVLKRWPNPAVASRDKDALAAFTPEFNLPPEHIEHSRLPYFFGWAVTDDWLRVFAQCARGPTPDDHYGGYGMKVLREVSRAVRPDNGLAIIYEPVVHAAAPFERGSDVYSENAHKFWVASIRNTAFLDYLYYRLPTVAQYMWLCAVMPGEPQWYRGVIGTDEYIESLRVCDTYAQVH
ncbi:hypothetical protein VTO73DRAFT_4003 [Trametes versicolor]